MDFSTRRLFKVLRWAGDSTTFDENGHSPLDDIAETEDINAADIVSSEAKPLEGFTSKHMVMFDVDIPMEVIESSTPGHYHVYFPGTGVGKDALFYLLAELSNCGIVEPGYVAASKARGFTALRLPWVRKEQ